MDYNIEMDPGIVYDTDDGRYDECRYARKRNPDYIAHIPRCKYCRSDNVKWKNEGVGWRLFNSDGTLHICNAYTDARDSKDFTEEAKTIVCHNCCHHFIYAKIIHSGKNRNTHYIKPAFCPSCSHRLNWLE